MSINKNSDNITVQYKDAGGKAIKDFNGKKVVYKEEWDDDVGFGSSAVRYVTTEVGPNIKKNELHKFSSFNTIFTLACLTIDEINNPYSLRIKTPNKVILRNGGSSKSKFVTQYDRPLEGGATAAREFFITDVEIQTVVAPNPKTKHTNAYKINFTVVEPYSLGTFIETIRSVAAASGHKNHTAAPYCLILEFKGYDQAGKEYTVEQTKRVIPMKIIQIDFEANQSGSTYSCQAVGWSEQALDGVIQTIQTDIKIQGKTVQEMLQVSLQEQLNKIKKKRNDEEELVKHQIDDYIINFPTQEVLQRRKNNITTDTDTANKGKMNPDEQRKSLVGTNTDVKSDLNGISYKQTNDSLNEIGKFKILVNESQIKDITERLVYDRNKKIVDTAQVAKDLKKGILNFKSGTNIENIITNVIIFSEYAAKSLNDSSGKSEINWFRIIPRTFIIKDDDIMKKYGRYPYLYVFDVVTYPVHESVFAKPNAKTDVKDFETQLVKEYDYYYTGKNLDILDFQLKYNMAFLAVLPADAAKSKSRDDDKTRASKDGNNTLDDKSGDTSDSNTASGTTITGVVRRQFNQYEVIDGLSDEQRLALEFNEAIIHSNADLVQINLSILGDPYYIADSGTGNYYANVTEDPTGKPSKFVNKDGAMEGTFSGVYIAINFRTPLDYNSNGQMMMRDTASQAEKFIPVPAFSGIYRVNMVTHSFQGGLFKQELQCNRLANQEVKKKPEKNNKSILPGDGKTFNADSADEGTGGTGA
jgi:hypothetical protein